MAPSFVRGNVLFVHSAPPAWAGAVSPLKGDRLTVGLRKKGGWLRVRNHRTGEVSSLKVGPWIQKTPVGSVPKAEVPATVPAPVPTFNVKPSPSSGLDDLIRVNQIQALEARIQQMSNDFFNEKTRLEACVDRLTRTNEVQTRELESYQRALDNQRTEAAASAIQLVEAKSKQVDLYEKLEAATRQNEATQLALFENNAKMTADAEAYSRQVDQLTRVNAALRQSETELSEHLERATKQLHDVRPIGPIYSHREFDWVYPEELDDEEAAEVNHLGPHDPVPPPCC